MLEALGARLTAWAERWLPSPLALVALLTLLTLAAALVATGFDGPRVLRAWIDGAGGGRGFWSLLGFAMQMALILVTGHALAESPPLRRLLAWLAGRPRTVAQAVWVVALGALILGLLNWGLGLIGGALLARAVTREGRARGLPLHAPVLAAAGYGGMAIWHGGLSGSAPLKVTALADLAAVLGPETAARVGPIPLSRTLGAWPNLATAAAALVLVPWLLVRLHPKDPARCQGPAAPPAEDPPAEAAADTPAGRLEHSRLLAWTLAGVGLLTGGLWLDRQGLDRLDPDLLNFGMLFLGLALHGSLASYGRAVETAARGCGGIVLQFPFYAGIMGLLAGTGLLAWMAQALAGLGAAALPAAAFYMAGAVNLFVPSGGGQWTVQGPILMEAALSAGIDPARMVLALAYGDQWTNLLQPFWALPLLALTGCRAHQLMGYTATVLLALQAVFVAALYLGW